MFETDGMMVRASRGLAAGVVALALASGAGAHQAPVESANASQDSAAPEVASPKPAPKKSPRPATAPRASKTAPRELTIEQQDASSVLDALVEQARAIDDQATRIRVEGRVAELLYERDPERARKLFRRAFDDVESLNESSVDPSFAPVGARLTLRVELLSTLYSVDPVLAAQLAATLDEDPENYDGGGLPYENQSDQSATLLRVAQSLASSDPRLAADLARQGIAGGVPVEFAILLPAIGRVDRAIADDLAGEALRVATSGGLSLVDVAGALPYVFPEAETYGSVQAGPSTRSSDLRRAFLTTAINVAARYAGGLNARLTQSAGDSADPWSIFEGEGLAVNYEIAEQIVPLFDAVDPERSAAFRGLTAQIANAMPVDMRSSISTSVARTGEETAESVAAKAETVLDVRSREELLGRAATIAADRGDVDLAKTYAGRIEDPARRTSVRSTVALQAIRAALAERRYDDARRYAADIADIRMRASAYTQIAAEMSSSGKRALAAECLDDAQVALIKDDAVMTREKAEALIRVANAYAALDPIRGFDVMRAALDAVNTGLRRVDGTSQSAQSAARRNPGLVFQLGALDPSRGLEILARTDYFRSLGLAQRLESRALSVLAQIGAVRGALRTRAPAPPAPRAPVHSASPARAPEPVTKPDLAAPEAAPGAPSKPELAPLEPEAEP
ncbi:MAG: hypothetical protein IPF53_04165 [Blastocatellia bacterium]|nr:hypothetical protein [Blastocatellia bacterium]